MQQPSLHLAPPQGLALLLSNGSSTRHAQGWVWTINLALEGTIEVETPAGRARGAVVITGPGVERRSSARGPVLTLLLDGDDHRASRDAFSTSAPTMLEPSPSSWRLMSLADALANRRALDGAEVLGRASRVVPTGTSPLKDPRLDQLLEELRRAESLSRPLQPLARRLGLTAPYLSERFVEVVGLPLKRWLLWERTRRSLRRLATDGGGAAAAAAGFADQAHMVRTFSKLFGYTPGTLQRAVRR